MPRTTLDIDASVLAELKDLKQRKGKSLGQLASELLAAAMHGEADPSAPPHSFRWNVEDMNAKVDLEDKDALERALER